MKRANVAPLMQYVPAISPRLRPPLHLAPVVAAIERSEREPVHAVVSIPPRHAKSETFKHAIVRRLRKNPHTRIAYVTYAASFAQKKSREIRQLFERAGGRVIEDANTLADWRTSSTGVDDGGLWSTSIGGPITGEGFDLVIIDDAVKSRAIAESGTEREKLVDWYRDTLSTREEPGASTFVVGARWTTNDLAGTLIADGYEHINLPAISDAGEALWPERYPLAALERIKTTLGAYGWASLYMGRPFARGGAVFHDCFFYDSEPPNDIVVTIGIDLAYSRKARADYSVAVVLGKSGDLAFVLDVIRVQVEAPEFIRILAALKTKWVGAKVTGYFGGTERGVIDVMAAIGLKIDAKPAIADKFTRAQPVAAAWNAGKILLPRKAPWLDAFVAEVVSFTGDDVRDDQVDALAGAFDEGPRFSGQGLLEWYTMEARKSQGIGDPIAAARSMASVEMLVPERFKSSSTFCSLAGHVYGVNEGRISARSTDVPDLLTQGFSTA